MSKLKPPVFEKPEEPDFIKRLKSTTQAASQAQERPLTDAPAREDEMPAIEGATNESDIDKLRELYGLQKTSVGQESLIEEKLTLTARPIVTKERLAGVGRGLTGASKKRLKHLETLKSVKGSTSDGIDDRDSDQLATPNTTPKTYKKPTTGRKKMKLSEVEE